MSDWTDERIERLKRLWASGLSCSQIAAKLGGLSRNAVIGKVHRLGLAGRRLAVRLSDDERRRRHRDRERARAQNAPRRVKRSGWRQMPADAVEPTRHLPAQTVEAFMPNHCCTIIELSQDTCRWPLWGLETDHGLYCGGKPVPGLPYCLEHCRMSYQPPRPREVKSRRAAA